MVGKFLRQPIMLFYDLFIYLHICWIHITYAFTVAALSGNNSSIVQQKKWIWCNVLQKYNENQLLLVTTWNIFVLFVLFVFITSRLTQKDIEILWYLFMVIANPCGQILCSKLFEELVKGKGVFESKETLVHIDFRYSECVFWRYFALTLLW